MKVIYNTTDVTPPGSPARQPKTLIVGGRWVEPGSSITVDDTFLLRSVSSLIVDGSLSVDRLPDWYVAAKKAKPSSKRDEEGDVIAPPFPKKKKKSKE